MFFNALELSKNYKIRVKCLYERADLSNQKS